MAANLTDCLVAPALTAGLALPAWPALEERDEVATAAPVRALFGVERTTRWLLSTTGIYAALAGCGSVSIRTNKSGRARSRIPALGIAVCDAVFAEIFR